MIIVFLPAYNEEAALPKVVEKFGRLFKMLDTPSRIVVMDDGSSDGTYDTATELLRHHTMALLRHEKNMGLGPTMRDGLLYIAEHSSDDDIVVTMDCDDTHDPAYTEPALAKLRKGCDVVVLSRYQEGGGERGQSPFRSLVSRCSGLLLKLFFPIEGVRDYRCGYRVFRASCLKKAVAAFGKDFIKLVDMGFAVSPEILIKFRMLGFKIEEVPFVLHYDRKPAPSKNRPFKTIAGYFALIVNYWGRRAPGL